MVQLGALRRAAARRSSPGGQQQRVALARALVFEPELVLMDEPLGALDKQLREHMQFEIKHLHEQLGVTVVYVTHDQSEALTMSDRVAVFNDGRIQQLAPPDRALRAPEQRASSRSSSARTTGCVGKISRVRRAALRRRGRWRDRAGRWPSISAGSAPSTTLSLRPERVALGEAANGYPTSSRAGSRS